MLRPAVRCAGLQPVLRRLVIVSGSPSSHFAGIEGLFRGSITLQMLKTLGLGYAQAVERGQRIIRMTRPAWGRSGC